jgi:RNA polymerase sigma-70 factor (ECF subfamily)
MFLNDNALITRLSINGEVEVGWCVLAMVLIWLFVLTAPKEYKHCARMVRSKNIKKLKYVKTPLRAQRNGIWHMRHSHRAMPFYPYLWCNPRQRFVIEAPKQRMVENINIQEVIDGCVEGKRKYQYKLYQMYASKMMGLCMRYAQNQAEAEDILQDGFVKVFGHIHKFQPYGPFEGWVRRIFVNTAIEYYRQRRKFLINDIEIENQDFEFNENVVDSLAAEEILGLIKEMPDGYRMVFNMYAIEGYSHKEIADELGISVGTSKSQYSRARSYLQRQMAAIEKRELQTVKAARI